MPRPPRSVDQAIARFDQYAARLDGHKPAAYAAWRRQWVRSAASLGHRLANIGIAISAIILATMAYGLFISPIGWGGLFLVMLAVLFVLVFFSAQGGEKALPPFTDQMPNKDVVRTLDSFILRCRSALPVQAARPIDVISQQLPLLESKLSQIDPLDPLAQDARRLMGKHLPELIECYARVPAAYRTERDSEGISVDERLAASLDAAGKALGDIGAKLAQKDIDAFETQGRFIESRYQDGNDISGA